MGDFYFWAWMGTIDLILLTIKDYSNNMLVDDRLNYIMLGLSFSLYFYFERSLWYILPIILIITVLNIFLNKYKAIGGADVSSITWILLGFAIIGFFKFVMFGTIFIIMTIIYNVLKLAVFKYKKPTPFYPVILLSFVLVNAIFGFYL